MPWEDSPAFRGSELKELVGLSREGTTLILDEVSILFVVPHVLFLPPPQFYSWYIYSDNEKDLGKSISSAEYIQDVNEASTRPV